MFTGLIQDTGEISKISTISEGRKIVVKTRLWDEIKIDDSVSLNGACQTAIEVSESGVAFEAVHGTLQKTTLDSLRSGDMVNLELALRPMDRMGGHFVQGHVNDVCEILNIQNRGKNFVMRLKLPHAQKRFVVQEGSVCLEGVSLTVFERQEEWFSVSVIPHTWFQTVLQKRRRGDFLNLEVDILAKYLYNFSKYPDSSPSNSFPWSPDKGYHL